VGDRFLWVLPGLAIVGVAGFSAAQRVRVSQVVSPHQREIRENPLVDRRRVLEGGKSEPLALVFPLLLLAIAFYLLVGVELFYLTDLFGNRMNTVFKVYFQSWLLLAIVGAYGIYYACDPPSGRPSRRYREGGTEEPGGHPQSPVRKPCGFLHLLSTRSSHLGYYSWVGVVIALLVASLYYPVGAVLDRTGVFNESHTLRDNTLDGLGFLKKSDPGEYAAITWLRDQAPWGRMVEAVGDDYSDYGRISASTGRPTVLGWKGHEHQWRGTTRVFDGREEDVARIYRSDDEAEVEHLLQRYGVRYVYVGRRERSTYGSEHLSKFNEFMKTAFQQDGVIIYERVEGYGRSGAR
jgi:uncharacterized membrane protein